MIVEIRQLTFHRCVCVVLDMINYRRSQDGHAHARTTTINGSELARVFSMLSTWTPFGDNAYNINDPVRSHATAWLFTRSTNFNFFPSNIRK